MSKTGRQIILGIIVTISVCVILIMLLYGSGYSINWQQLAIQSTGGFTVVTIPKDALATIEPIGLQRSTPTSVSLLQPGLYRLQIEQSGYIPVEYSFMLEPRRIIQFDPVMLWPSHPNVKPVDAYPGSTLQPDSHTITFNEQSTQLLWNHSKNKALLQQPHTVYLYDSATRQLVSLLRQGAAITEIQWYTDDWYVLYISDDVVHVLDTRVHYGHNDVVLYQGKNVHDLRLGSGGREIFFTSDNTIYELGLR